MSPHIEKMSSSFQRVWIPCFVKTGKYQLGIWDFALHEKVSPCFSELHKMITSYGIGCLFCNKYPTRIIANKNYLDQIGTGLFY